MQKTNKKLVKLLIFEIAAIAAIIYFTQTSRNTTRLVVAMCAEKVRIQLKEI